MAKTTSTYELEVTAPNGDAMKIRRLAVNEHVVRTQASRQGYTIHSVKKVA